MDAAAPSSTSVLPPAASSDLPPATTPEPEPPPSDPDPQPPGLPAGDDTTVESVVDGDTIVVAGGTRVRLIGIDTPETRDPRTEVQCFGKEASAATSALLGPGTPVRLAYDVERFDRYGRTLAYVYRRADGLFVNAALVDSGFALPATVPPNVAHVEELATLARAAREGGRGLWSACGGELAPATASPDPPSSSGGTCDPSYAGVCIPSPPPDLDCGDIAQRRFSVVRPDPHRFDADGDGVGCES